MAEELIFSFILDPLRDLVIHETQFLLGVEDQVKKLELQLNHMRWFLRNTSANQERVLEWVIQVRNLAYEAEYLIESYAIKVGSRRHGGIRGTIRRISGCFNECYHRHNIGSDIETVMSKIDDLTERRNEYGITEIMGNTDGGASVRSQLRRTYSGFNDEDEMFVGSDNSINMLVEKLVSDKYRSITLCGMGGLGKSTLAKKLYFHPVVMKHFDGFAWVYISQQWNKVDILQDILIKLMPPQKGDEIKKWGDAELVRQLSKYLSTRKCLVVLDDIWKVDAWHSIEPAIPINEKGSKILLTTRITKVGSLVDAYGYKHVPEFLSTDDSWKLLCNKALKGKDFEETMKMEKVGKEIIAECGGLPLAVVTIGGILSSQSSYSEWESVRDNMSYLLKDGNGEKNVETILALSYDYLPFHLKPCFLYLSKYAEDAEIEVETIYQQWMAEGMVSSKHRMGDNETVMDVAEHYLIELAQRCMVFFENEKDESYTMFKFKSFRLHDLMRDLCISKAKKEKFLQSIDYGKIHDVDEGREASNICRLSISFPGKSDANRFVPPAKDVRRSLRSFTLQFQDKREEKAFKLNLSEFVMLRVLSLDGFGTKDDEAQHKDPFSIDKLLHLRYLSLWNIVYPIMSSSISSLKLLQTLDLRGCDNFRWISDVWNLPRLNHLYLPFNIQLGDSAKKLGFDGIPQLEILEGFNNKVCNVKHLSTLKNLRKLEARVENELEDLEELINQVRKLTHLRYLGLTVWIDDLSSEKAEGIMNDILSYSNLVTLDIFGKLSKFPEYDTGLCQNLRSLTLWNCEIEEDPVCTLERLPNLSRLYLNYKSYVGKEMSCHASGFPQLRVLVIELLSNLEKWEIEDGAMPNLTQLMITGCSELSMIPAGLRSNTLLKELNIWYMPEEFNKRIRVNEEGEEGPDFHKLRHVQTINILIL